jgi:hypothetical protein
MLTIIKDPQFLTTFYRLYCRRGVYGKSNQAAIGRMQIEVGWMPAYGEQLEICICDNPGEALIELGWDPVEGASPIHFMPFDIFLGRCDRVALTQSLRRFLLKHGVIDANGVPIKRGVA